MERQKIRMLADWAVYGRPIAYEVHSTYGGFAVYSVHVHHGAEVLSDAEGADFNTSEEAFSFAAELAARA